MRSEHPTKQPQTKWRRFLKPSLLAAVLFFTGNAARSQQTVGLFTHGAGSLDSGYVLFAPLSTTTTYLIDKCGKQVHSWPSIYTPLLSAYLLDDGTLLRPAAVKSASPSENAKTLVEKIAWDGTVTWRFFGKDSDLNQHHDICALPNGNVLVLGNDFHSRSEALAAGRDTAFTGTQVGSETLTEYQPVGADSAIIVWQWHAWDHLVQEFDPARPNYGAVANHPELINVNFPIGSQGTDWLHINSVDYNAALDQILLSCHNFNELWIIDHATTTAEAASHSGGARGKGGDLIYRWGNPQAYHHGSPPDRKLFGQHAASWIRQGLPNAGKLLVFNNGNQRPAGPYTSVEIVAPAVDASGNYDSGTLPYLPLASEWIYTATPPTSLFSPGGGGAQTLSNGDVLICIGNLGRLREVDAAGNIVWEYVSPVGDSGPVAQGTVPNATTLFRATFYPYSFSGFHGKVIAAGAPIERDPIDIPCTLNVGPSSVVGDPAPIASPFNVFPNPASDHLTITAATLPGHVVLYDFLGKQILQSENAGAIDISSLHPGVYHIVAGSGARMVSQMVTVVR